MSKEDLRYMFIALVISTCGGIVANYFVSLNVVYIVFLSVIAVLIVTIRILHLRLRRTGIVAVYPNRGALTGKEIELISKAKKNIRVLGISHRTLWGETESFPESLIEAGEKGGAEITFLTLNPKGENLCRRARDEGGKPGTFRKEIESSIARFEELKEAHPTIKLEVYTYDIFPIWHMVIIDDNIALIGYYPARRVGAGSPLYLIKENDLSLLAPVIKCFDAIKSSGNRII